MPVKPTDALPEWASGAAYVAPGKPWDGTARRDATGLAGSAGDGFTPETPSADPPAENENEWLHRAWQWIDTWLRAGSFTADLDSRVVETDINGDTAIARLVLGGTANAMAPLSVSSNAAGAAASFTDTIGNFAATAAAGGASAALRGTNTGTGAGLEGISLGSTGPGVFGDAGSGGNAGVEGDGGTGGHGVQGTSGSAGGFGVRGVSINGSPAVQGEGSAADASSEGVQGVAGHDDAHGVRGFTTATANTGAAACRGDGRGDGDGVHGDAEDGYGVISESDVTTPTRAAHRLVPQDTDPSTHLEGDFYYNDAQVQPKIRDSAGWKGIWFTAGGIARGFDSDGGFALNNANENQGAVMTVDPKQTGQLLVEANGVLGASVGASLRIRIRRGNNQLGTVIATYDLGAFNNTGGPDEKAFFIRGELALPDATSSPYELTIERVAGAGTVYLGLNTVEGRGVY